MKIVTVWPPWAKKYDRNLWYPITKLIFRGDGIDEFGVMDTGKQAAIRAASHLQSRNEPYQIRCLVKQTRRGEIRFYQVWRMKKYLPEDLRFNLKQEF